MEKKEKYLIQCLFCEKYLGYSNTEKKKVLKVCNEICRNNLNEKLDQDLNERTKSKMNSWQKISSSEEELVVFTEKQYQDLVDNVQALEKGQNISGSAKSISQLLMGVRK